MRDKWYSDNRDLIKWSVLLLLAREHHAHRILQIAFLNPSELGEIEIDGHLHPIPNEVISHFRDIRKVSGLSQQPKISVFDLPLGDRANYLRAVVSFIASFSQDRCLVFLDPDTGLEPNARANAKHVLNDEARIIWDALPAKWTYVFYQHETNRSGKPWIEQKRAQFASAIGVRSDKVGVASGPKIAKDVVFFHTTKV